MLLRRVILQTEWGQTSLFPSEIYFGTKSDTEQKCCCCWYILQMYFMWRGPGFLEICHTRAYQPCLYWVGHWCQANAKRQTRTNTIFETLGGLDCQGSEQVRREIFLFLFLPVFCFLFHPPWFFLPLEYPPFFHSFRLFFLSFLLFSIHSCFPSVFCIPLSFPPTGPPQPFRLAGIRSSHC